MENNEPPSKIEPIALVVDDEPLILMDTADIISEAGYQVVEATSADEAFAFLERHPSLELVFTDVQMPGRMDGLMLAKAISERWPHISTIVASGAVRPGNDLPPGVRFINKPFSALLVYETIRQICDDPPAALIENLDP